MPIYGMRLTLQYTKSERLTHYVVLKSEPCSVDCTVKCMIQLPCITSGHSFSLPPTLLPCRKVQSGDGMGLNMAIDEDNIYSGVELELPPYINYPSGKPGSTSSANGGAFLSLLLVF